jgi:hypothetical protein
MTARVDVTPVTCVIVAASALNARIGNFAAGATSAIPCLAGSTPWTSATACS